MDNVCNRRLFSFPAKVEMAEEQEYLCCLVMFITAVCLLFLLKIRVLDLR